MFLIVQNQPNSNAGFTDLAGYARFIGSHDDWRRATHRSRPRVDSLCARRIPTCCHRSLCTSRNDMQLTQNNAATRQRSPRDCARCAWPRARWTGSHPRHKRWRPTVTCRVGSPVHVDPDLAQLGGPACPLGLPSSELEPCTARLSRGSGSNSRTHTRSRAGLRSRRPRLEQATTGPGPPGAGRWRWQGLKLISYAAA